MSETTAGTSAAPATLIRPPWHQRGRFAALAAALLGSLAALGLLALLLVPGMRSALAAEVADGREAFWIVAGFDLRGTPDGAPVVATVVPGEGWTVRPDPGGRGPVIASPDGVLTVRLSPHDEAEFEAETVLGGIEQAGGAVAAETLASGLELRHATVGRGFTGVLETDDGPVAVEAQVSDTAEFADYRPALAELLESVTDG